MKKIRILFFISIMMLLCLFISACSRNTIHKEVKFSATVALNKVEIQETKSNTINRDDQRKERIINAQIKMYEMFSDKASGNYVISPLSIYMAFSLLHEIGSANVKKELEDAFNLTSADYEFAGEVFKNMVFESYKDESSNLLSCLQLSNTIWLDSSIKANSEPLDRLAKTYYCYAFNTDFQKHNAKANKDIREFIKSKTNGLIDKDFNIDSDTLFALINTVYLKDLWNYYGDDLPKEKRNFNYTGKEELINFLMGSYTNGQAAKSEIAQTFYTNSRMFKINFVVAGENHTLKEAMAYDNLNYLRNNPGVEEDDDYIYFTRCIFPCFSVNGSIDIKDELTKKGLLTETFAGFTGTLYDTLIKVSGISHDAKLVVNEKGLEGAAVTIIRGAGAAAPDPKEKVYLDFNVNKEFGFYVTDNNGFIIFMGQVTNPDK